MKGCIVCLDLTNYDEHILKACKNIVSPLLGYNRFEFINVVNNLVHPQHEVHQIIDCAEPQNDLDSKIRKIIERKVKRVTEFEKESCQFTVLEGRPYRELLHRAEAKEASITIVGCKSRSSHSGITPKRLAHNLDTDILFIPEAKSGSIDNILVPIDFSDKSFEALQLAVDIASKNDTTTVTALHIMSTSYSYAYTTTYYNEYNAMLIEKSKRTMEGFIGKLNTNFDRLESTLLKSSQFSTADNIKDYSETSKTDLIIIGAQSHGRFRNFLIGSTTESLISLRPNTPLLVKR